MFQPIRRSKALIKKEFKQIIRDPSSISIALVLPIILLIIFGFGVSLDAKNLRIGLVMEASTPEMQELAASFLSSKYFDVQMGRDRREFIPDLDAGRIRGIIVIPQNFSAKLKQTFDQAAIQIITDGSEPNIANFVQNYARGAWNVWLQQQSQRDGVSPKVPIQSTPRYCTTANSKAAISWLPVRSPSL